VAFDTSPAWRQVTPALKEELVAFWKRNKALGDPALAAARADQAVCIGRDDKGALCAVGTAELRTLPRLRQPMYYYRQFFAESQRGQRQAVPFARRAKEILQAYNATLPAPEALGMLVELESKLLDALYTLAYAPKSDYTFIGYSQRGLQLRVSYFEGATLLKPRAPARG
jgi:hypothetical protein